MVLIRGGMLPGKDFGAYQSVVKVKGVEWNDFMLKEVDGCDPAASHVPCGVSEGLALTLLPLRYSQSRPLALLSSALLQHLETV